MSQTFYTSQAAKITLGAKLGSGGEGEVYELRGQPELVAKLYHEPLAAEKAEKLQVLARLGNERLFKIAAWPIDVLRATPAAEVCGFLMRRLSQAAEVHTLHSPKSRLQKFPEASWAFLLYVAANIARAVATVHEQGFVIGDVNPKNILVTRQATVHLLDCDSFQVTAEGKTYRCAGGFPEYTPPELQGVIFRAIDRRPEHDWFGLGIVIFQLLFLGRHPFSGKFSGAGELTLERAIRERRFAYGADAAAREMQPPPGALRLEAVSEPLVELFRAAFLSAEAVARPRPREWIAPLERLAKSLKQCALHSGHRYWQELAACPWCEIETRARVRLFNFALNGKRGQPGYLRLDEVWREIENVAPPYVPPLPSSQALALAPSAEAEATARRKQNSFYLAILMSLVSGFAIGLWVGFPFALLLLFAAGFIIRRLTGTELDAGVQTLWQRPLGATDDPLTQRFEQAKQQAEAKLRQLAERWKNEASEERFHARLKELESRKVAYESLSFKRTQQLKRLEEQTRAAQLERFLAQFALDKTVLKNFAPAFYENLRLEGIRTAADLTSARLRKAPLVGAGLAQILLNWRNELEHEFAFDPQTIPPHLRVKLERKLDETRVQLEHDLRSGAFYLNRLKDEIKESQRALHAPLLAAQTALAQAEKDCEAVAKRNRFAPLAVCLLLAFFFGAFWKAGSADERRLVDNIARIERTQEAKQDSTQSWKFAEAQQLYEQGTESLKKGKYEEAIALYQHAITYNPKLAEAHHQLGYAYYRLKRYDKARTALLDSLAIHKGFEPYFDLGQVYFDQANWLEANAAFNNAIIVAGAIGRGEQYWQAHSYVAVSLVNLGAEKSVIESLNEALKQNPGSIEDHFQLGTLYLLTNQPRLARAQYRSLKDKDPRAAMELQKLMRQRGVQ